MGSTPSTSSFIKVIYGLSTLSGSGFVPTRKSLRCSKNRNTMPQKENNTSLQCISEIEMNIAKVRGALDNYYEE